MFFKQFFSCGRGICPSTPEPLELTSTKLLQGGEKLIRHHQNTPGGSHTGHSGDVWHTAAAAAPSEAMQGLGCHWEWWCHLSLSFLAGARRDARPGN